MGNGVKAVPKLNRRFHGWQGTRRANSPCDKRMFRRVTNECNFYWFFTGESIPTPAICLASPQSSNVCMTRPASPPPRPHRAPHRRLSTRIRSLRPDQRVLTGLLRLSYTVAPAVALALSLTACRKTETTPDAPNVFAIGVGAIPGRPGYESVVRGIDMAVERLNERGEARFRIRPPDTGSVSAIQVAQALRDDPTVIGVVGHPESGNSLEAIPVYADMEHDGRNGVVAISPTASSPRLSGINAWFFRVAPSDDVAARLVARWVLDSLHMRRAAVIYRNDSYGRDWSTTFSDTFLKAGATIVSRDPYLTGITEWDAYAQLMARLKPDVLLFPGDADDAVEMLRALRTAGVSLTFIGGDGTEGMRDSSVSQGASYVSFFHPDRIDTEEGRTFARRYREKYKQAPDMFAAMSYDAALAIGSAVNKGARTRLAVRRSLERLGTPSAPALEGAAGMIAFEKNHDISGRSVVITTIRSTSTSNNGID